MLWDISHKEDYLVSNLSAFYRPDSLDKSELVDNSFDLDPLSKLVSHGVSAVASSDM